MNNKIIQDIVKNLSQNANSSPLWDRFQLPLIIPPPWALLRAFRENRNRPFRTSPTPAKLNIGEREPYCAENNHKSWRFETNLSTENVPAVPTQSPASSGKLENPDGQPQTAVNNTPQFQTTKRNFRCPKCTKCFTSNSGLKQHMNIHASYKPFTCQVCQKSYTQFSNLCRHKRLHIRCRKRLPCADCNTELADHPSLLTHHFRRCQYNLAQNKDRIRLRSAFSKVPVGRSQVNSGSLKTVKWNSADIFMASVKTTHERSLDHTSPTATGLDLLDPDTVIYRGRNKLSADETEFVVARNFAQSLLQRPSNSNPTSGKTYISESSISSYPAISCNIFKQSSLRNSDAALPKIYNIVNLDRSRQFAHDAGSSIKQKRFSRADDVSLNHLCPVKRDDRRISQVKSTVVVKEATNHNASAHLDEESLRAVACLPRNWEQNLRSAYGYANNLQTPLESRTSELKESSYDVTMTAYNHKNISEALKLRLYELSNRLTKQIVPTNSEPMASQSAIHIKQSKVQNAFPRDSSKGSDNPYVCILCDKQFPRAANLNRHIRTHTGEQPYHCPHCQRSFSISSNMQRHVRNIHKHFNKNGEKTTALP